MNKSQMNYDADRTILISNILRQGKIYLELADEFFPFGATIDLNGAIQPLSASTGIEQPKSAELIGILEPYIKNRIINKEIRAGAIGIDVYITPQNSQDKKNGIEIRLFFFDDITQSKRFFYYKDRNQYSFEECH